MKSPLCSCTGESMAKVLEQPAEGSERVLIFHAEVAKSGSGRKVSGLVGIQYGVWETLRTSIQKSLVPGRYKLVVQQKLKSRWVHVSSEEIAVTLASS